MMITVYMMTACDTYTIAKIIYLTYRISSVHKLPLEPKRPNKVLEITVQVFRVLVLPHLRVLYLGQWVSATEICDGFTFKVIVLPMIYQCQAKNQKSDTLENI